MSRSVGQAGALRWCSPWGDGVPRTIAATRVSPCRRDPTAPVFTTSAAENPTLTIVTLAIRQADYIADLAANDPLILGMVAYAPLEYGDQVRVYLDSLMTRGPLIKGIRRGLPDPADATFDMNRFIQGIQILPEYGLSFDILGKGAPHLAMAVNIAQRAPDTSLILDHLLKPYIKEHQLEPWRAQMTQLASLPNVSTKISGMATEADLNNWTAEDLKPYVDHALSVFGEDRVVFGGDWPPILTANSTYARWVHTLDDLTSGMGAVAQRKLFGDNARSFYRLSPA